MGNLLSLCSNSKAADAVNQDDWKPTNLVNGSTAHNDGENHVSPLNEKSSVRSSQFYFDAAMSESDFNKMSQAEVQDMAQSIYFDTQQPCDDLLDYPPARVPNPHPSDSIHIDDPNTLLLLSSRRETESTMLGQSLVIQKELETPSTNLGMQGYPGELTKEELAKCLEFRRELKSLDKTYRDMLRCYRKVEQEPYALCRCLRARKFVPKATIEMMSEHVEAFRKAHSNDFFRDINATLGCPLSVFLTLLPFFYSGIDKNGCPVVYFLIEDLNIEGLDSLTFPEERIVLYIWYALKHGLEKAVEKGSRDKTRCELLVVVDLKGLSKSTINKRALGLLKSVKPAIMAFPEVLNRIVIINAPYYFSYPWMLIRKFIDPRTQAKVEIHSNNPKCLLLKLVDENTLLRNVGGNGPTFEQVLQEDYCDGSTRQVVKCLSLSSGRKSEVNFTLSGNEVADVTLFTNSTADVMLNGRDGMHVASPNGDPYKAEVAKGVKGPCKGSVAVVSKAKKVGLFTVYVQVKNAK